MELETRKQATLASLADDLCAYQETLEYIDSLIEETDDDVLLPELQKQREEVLAAINRFSAALVKKTDDCAAVIRRLQEEISSCDDEEERLARRKKRFLAAQKSLKEYILQTMQEKGVTQLKTPLNTISIRKNGGLQSMEIVNETIIPNELCRHTGKLSYGVYCEVYQQGPERVRVELERFKREPDPDLLRSATRCVECDGDGTVVDTADTGLPMTCQKCNGAGTIMPAGVRLVPRGHHIRLT